MASKSWHSKTKSLKDRSRKLYEDGLHSDITINLVDEQGTVVSFKAHKFILGMSSQVFEAMFYGPLAEKGKEITIEDITSKAFNNILRYTYLDELKLEAVSEVIQTALAAQKYMLDHLYDLCIEYLMMKKLSTSNAILCYNASKLFGEEKLGIESFKIISSNQYIFQSPNFVTLSKETVLALTDNRVIKFEPLALFNGLYKWSKHQSEIEGSSKSIREHMEPFLPQIEFLRLTSKDIFKTVIPTGVFSNEECIAIGRNLHENGVLLCPLPSWCNKCYNETTESHTVILDVENGTWTQRPNTEFILKFTVTEEVILYSFDLQKPTYIDVNAQLTTTIELSNRFKVTTEKRYFVVGQENLSMDICPAVRISPTDEFCKITAVCSSGTVNSFNGLYKSEQRLGNFFKLAIEDPTVRRPLFRQLNFGKPKLQFIQKKKKI